jgi:hypothetical protein
MSVFEASGDFFKWYHRPDALSGEGARFYAKAIGARLGIVRTIHPACPEFPYVFVVEGTGAAGQGVAAEVSIRPEMQLELCPDTDSVVWTTPPPSSGGSGDLDRWSFKFVLPADAHRAFQHLRQILLLGAQYNAPDPIKPDPLFPVTAVLLGGGEVRAVKPNGALPPAAADPDRYVSLPPSRGSTAVSYVVFASAWAVGRLRRCIAKAHRAAALAGWASRPSPAIRVFVRPATESLE